MAIWASWDGERTRQTWHSSQHPHYLPSDVPSSCCNLPFSKQSWWRRSNWFAYDIIHARHFQFIPWAANLQSLQKRHWVTVSGNSHTQSLKDNIASHCHTHGCTWCQMFTLSYTSQTLWCHRLPSLTTDLHSSHKEAPRWCTRGKGKVPGIDSVAHWVTGSQNCNNHFLLPGTHRRPGDQIPGGHSPATSLSRFFPEGSGMFSTPAATSWRI